MRDIINEIKKLFKILKSHKATENIIRSAIVSIEDEILKYLFLDKLNINFEK